MTPQQISDLTKDLIEALTPVAREEARLRADEVLGRLLNVDDHSLRNRVDAAVTNMIRKKLQRTVWIEVNSRPRRKR